MEGYVVGILKVEAVVDDGLKLGGEEVAELLY